MDERIWECESLWITDTWHSDSATLRGQVVAYNWRDGGEAMEYRVTLYKKKPMLAYPNCLPELRMLAHARDVENPVLENLQPPLVVFRQAMAFADAMLAFNDASAAAFGVEPM